MVYFYSYSSHSDASIIVSSIKLEKGDAYNIITQINEDFESANPINTEYKTFFKGSIILFGIATFTEGNSKELDLKMGDVIKDLTITDIPVNWNDFIPKSLAPKDFIKPFFRSFYRVN